MRASRAKLVVGAFLGCLMVACPGPSPRRERAIRRLAPLLDSTLAMHLAHDDSSAWHAYAVEAGPRPFMDGFIAVSRATADRNRADFLRDREPLAAFMRRVAEVLADEYAYTTPARYTQLIQSLDADHEFRMFQINHGYGTACSDTSLSAAQRLAVLEHWKLAADSVGDPYTSTSAQFSMAQLELELGRPERHQSRIASALRDARALEDDYLVCAILGALIPTLRSTDSALACVEEGLRLARRHRFPDQIARFMGYRAQDAANHGRYALAAKCMSDAADLTSAFGGSARLRWSITYAQFLAHLGCWDLVEGVLRRLPPLQREFPSAVEPNEGTKYAFGADILRARLAFAKGDVATGVAVLEHWSRSVPNWDRRIGLAQLYLAWSWGLECNGRLADALAVATRGVEHCDSSHVDNTRWTLELRRSRLLEDLGSIDAARVTLDDAVRRAAATGYPEANELIPVRVMRARLCLRAGARKEGLERLRQAFAGIRGDLEAGAADAAGSPGLTVRETVHKLVDLTPEQGYAFELEWRSRMRPPPFARDIQRADRTRDPFAPVPNPREVHLLYAFVDDRLLRWCAGPSGVTLDTLPLSPRTCLAEVREATALLQSEAPDSGSWYGPRTRRALDRLSRRLLPSSWSGRFPAALQISPDGPLQALPFEALLAPGPGREPLGLSVAVSYDLGWRGTSSPVTPATPLIFSSPSPSPSLRRRYASPALLQSNDVHAARALWTGSRLLEGDRATKAAFLLAAAEAPRLYVAGHHLSNPSVPFLGYLPVAAPADAPLGDALLEGSDVSGLDLSGCALVVLATCASGAQTASTIQPGPSLRDAFIDAGAHAVVSSFWDVHDEETSAFMRLFLSEFERDHDAARALERARQAAFAASPSLPPRVWAGWSVAITHERCGAGAPQKLAAGVNR